MDTELVVPPHAAAVFGPAVDRAAAYARLLATDGTIRGLIGPREVPRLWDRHLLNSAAIAALVPDRARVVDVGSGAGLPGIPLALARPDLRVTLLEPLARRAAFLTECVEQLGLDTVTVVRGRAEEGHIRRELGGADVVTARAVAPLDKLAGWCLPLLRSGGLLLALKGSTAAEELAAVQPLADAADAVVTEVGDPPATVVVVTRGTVRATARGGRAR
ncbi:MAG TPA: 16S rRNA (guanine(527)-N(7))-methyltransferase RsmG [Mycobacteriales bacterium]|nr:16S rRNA (guanine(527)-N(7))-methyltransferase RsmG [Mycobacteriales bacterium]